MAMARQARHTFAFLRVRLVCMGATVAGMGMGTAMATMTSGSRVCWVWALLSVWPSWLGTVCVHGCDLREAEAAGVVRAKNGYE